MSLRCSLTGEPLEHAVVSLKSGHVFEKRVIEKWLESSQSCPKTGDLLSREDLMALKCEDPVRSRPVSSGSIPGMIKMFQDEWDALMLESHQLKKQLNDSRKELAHSLYQHDAACRVIARLIQERDDARSELNEKISKGAFEESSSPMEIEDAPSGEQSAVSAAQLPETLKKQILEKAKELTTARKARILPPSLARSTDIERFSLLHSRKLHVAKLPGIHCITLNPHSQTPVTFTGGEDHTIVVFDHDSQLIRTTLRGHLKPVVDLDVLPLEENEDSVLVSSASHDKTARLWLHKEESGVRKRKRTRSSGEQFKCIHTVKGVHEDHLTACHIHPGARVWLTASIDGSWALHDVDKTRCLTRVGDVDGAFTCFRFHPDGLVCAGGSQDGVVKFYEVNSTKNVENLRLGECMDRVVSFDFSENGYHIAIGMVGTEKSFLRVWDLRKTPTCIHTTAFSDPISCVRYDNSGNFLSVGCGNVVRLFDGQDFQELASFQEHTSQVTDLAFGLDAKTLYSSSLDGSLQVIGVG